MTRLRRRFRVPWPRRPAPASHRAARESGRSGVPGLRPPDQLPWHQLVLTAAATVTSVWAAWHPAVPGWALIFWPWISVVFCHVSVRARREWARWVNAYLCERWYRPRLLIPLAWLPAEVRVEREQEASR